MKSIDDKGNIPSSDLCIYGWYDSHYIYSSRISVDFTRFIKDNFMNDDMDEIEF